MISNFFWLMNFVRQNILEEFILPELDISYWDFCIILAVVGIVATVLLNSVRIGASSQVENVYDKEKHKSKERMRAWDDAKAEYNRSKGGLGSNIDYDLFEKMLNRDD